MIPPSPAFQPDRGAGGFQPYDLFGFQTEGALVVATTATRLSLSSPTKITRHRTVPNPAVAAKLGLQSVRSRKLKRVGDLQARLAAQSTRSRKLKRVGTLQARLAAQAIYSRIRRRSYAGTLATRLAAQSTYSRLRRRTYVGALAARLAAASPTSIRKPHILTGLLSAVAALQAVTSTKRRLSSVGEISARLAVDSIRARARRVTGTLGARAALASPSSFHVQPPRTWTVGGDLHADLHLSAATLFIRAGLGYTGTLSLAATIASPRARRRVPLIALSLEAALEAVVARRRAASAELASRLGLSAETSFQSGQLHVEVVGTLSLRIGLASPTSGPRPTPPTPGPGVVGAVRRERWRYAYTGDLGLVLGLTARTLRRPRPAPVRVTRHRHAVVGHMGARLLLTSAVSRLDYLEDVVKPDDALILELLDPTARFADVRDDDVLLEVL